MQRMHAGLDQFTANPVICSMYLCIVFSRSDTRTRPRCSIIKCISNCMYSKIYIYMYIYVYIYHGNYTVCVCVCVRAANELFVMDSLRAIAEFFVTSMTAAMSMFKRHPRTSPVVSLRDPTKGAEFYPVQTLGGATCSQPRNSPRTAVMHIRRDNIKKQ